MGKFRFRVLIISVAAAAVVVLAGCGPFGGDGEEGDIKDTLEQGFTTNSAAVCKLESEDFLRNTTGEDDEDAALESCRDSAEDALKADEAEVSDIEIDGDEATATVKLTGEDLDGQEIDVELVKNGKQWQVDSLDGYEFDDETRDVFNEKFKEAIAKESSDELADCVVEELDTSVSNDLLAEASEGKSTEPGEEVKAKAEEAGTFCAGAGSGDTFGDTSTETSTDFFDETGTGTTDTGGLFGE